MNYINFEEKMLNELVEKFIPKKRKGDFTRTFNLTSFICNETDAEVLGVPVGTWVMLSEKQMKHHYPNGRKN